MIGLSIGSENTCIGVLKNNNVDIILSDTSQRTLPTMISFCDRQRTFGDLANFTIKSNYTRTFPYITRFLLPKHNLEQILEKEKKFMLIDESSLIVENSELFFNINYKQNNIKLSPEAILGIFLSKVKQHWSKKKIDLKEISISVPDYFTTDERYLVLEAAKIAELNPILVNESSAISLNYGLFRRNQFEESLPRIVGFVDFGQSKTNIFFTRFTRNNHKIISVTNERHCGARDIDYSIMEFLDQKFYEKYKINPIKSTKCKIRMMETIAKSRKILTGIKETQINIDSLMEGEDLSYLMTRNEFEKICEGVLSNFRSVLLKSLEEAKLKPSDLHSVEMVGDAVRIPIIQAIVKEVFGLEISKTLSPDETVANGSTLYSAMNSQFCTLRDFHFEHCHQYPIILRYPLFENGQVNEKSYMIFNKNDYFPCRKSLKFDQSQVNKSEKFEVFLFALDAFKEIKIASFLIDLSEIKEENFIFAFDVYLDQNNILDIDKALALEEYEEEEESGKSDGSKIKVKKERRVIAKIKKTFSNQHNRDYTKIQVDSEKKFDEEDREFNSVLLKKNELETAIYNYKDKLSGELKEYISQNELDKINTVFDRFRNWVETDSDEAYSKEKVNEISWEVKIAIEKINRRKEEVENYPSYIEKMKRSIKSNIGRYEYQIKINGEIEGMKELLNDFEEKIKNVENEIQESPKNVDLKYNKKIIENMIKEFEKKVNNIYNTIEKSNELNNSKAPGMEVD